MYKSVDTNSVSSKEEISAEALWQKNNPHITPHAQSQGHICSLCSKSYSTKGNLHVHVKSIHNKVKPFKCSECSGEYISLCRLKCHMRNHYGHKPFECSFCGKAFSQKGILKTHEALHSSIRPFNCSICQKSFKTKGHVKDHMNCHYKQRDYQCEVCEKRFTRKTILKVHLRIHTGIKPYLCPYENCTKSFVENGNMITHYKRHFQGEADPNINIKNSLIPELEEMFKSIIPELNSLVNNDDRLKKTIINSWKTI